MDQQNTFSGWAIVEIMGHNKEIGFVTTEYFGGPALFRVDQSELPEREYELQSAEWIEDKLCGPGTKVQREATPGKTAYVGPSSIFRMNPCSKETVLAAIERAYPAPIKILHFVERRAGLVAAPANAPAYTQNNYIDSDEDGDDIQF